MLRVGCEWPLRSIHIRYRESRVSIAADTVKSAGCGWRWHEVVSREGSVRGG